jgi:type I restriction enzyme S subunit
MSKWPLIKLGKILTESKIEATNSDANSRIRVLLNANGVIKRPLTKETEGATKYFERKAGQFIYGKQNLHKGAFGIIPEELDGFSSSSDLPSFDVSDKCDPQWINYFLRQGDFYLSLIDIAKGAATKRIQPKALFEVKIPLPELAVQKKIIRQFIAQEEKTKIIESEIQTQKQLLSQLKQAILQEAIQGKLTAKWRAQNPNTEPASELLKRIKAEKAQLIKDKKIKKEKPLPPITQEEIPFELPEGWVWCRLIDVSTKIHYGMTASAIKGKKDIRLLRITDIQDNKVDWASVPGCQYSDKDIENYLLCENDIVIARTGGTIGKSYIVKQITVESLFASYLIRIVPSQEISAEYVKIFLESPWYWNQLYDMSRGAQPNVSGTKLKHLILPFPLDINEQQAIVEKVETLMQKCQALEEEIKTSEANAQMLMQAVLKEAFEGKKEVVEG